MAYSSQEDIEKLIPTQELAELTAESGGTPDADVVAEAIAKADAEIDSYLGVRYAVPLATVPARLKSLSEDIAIYYLYVRRSAVPEPRELAYKNAIAFLRDVSKGIAVIVDSGGSEISGSSASSGTPQLSSADSIFDRDNMTTW